MEQKINIAELLKDCPKGMELDCILFNNPVKYDGIDIDDAYPIKILTENDEYFYFTKEGYLYHVLNSKCLIFPKGKTTWEGFVPPCKFKDGDILFVDCSDEEDKTYQYIFILNKIECYGKWYSYCHLNGVGDFHLTTKYLTDDEFHPRFATEEEKQKLFQAIKDNGYKWNPETKTLEKLVKPKFKVGDIIQDITGICKVKITEVNVEDKCYLYKSLNINGIGSITFNRQDDWELVPSKFDINTLKPFDKVLVRSDNSDVWECDFFSLYNPKCSNRFHCIGAWYNICIPYIGNEHLLGTTNDCDDFYKTWE